MLLSALGVNAARGSVKDRYGHGRAQGGTAADFGSASVSPRDSGHMLDNRNLRRDLFALALVALTAFFALSLLTYDPAIRRVV